VNAFLNPRVI